MKTFKEYVLEKVQEGIGLTIFDIDETLFKTSANILVKKGDEVVRKLNNQEFNNYKLKDGEEFDFGEFRDAEHFLKTSEPIKPMIAKMKAIAKNVIAKGSKMIIVTARADFDDKKKFLNTFRKQGIPIDDVYVERAGNLNLGSSAKNKKIIFNKYLKTGKYARVRLYDDAQSNITSFLSLQKKYKDISFEAYLVDESGGITRKK